MKIKPLLALAGTLILFSTYEIASKSIASIVPPLQINFWRFMAGGLILLPIAMIINYRAHRRLTGTDLLRLSRLGLVMIAISLPLLQVAIVYIPASAAAVLFCTNPLFAHLFSAIIDKEHLSKRTWTGLLISLGGIILIIISELMKLNFSGYSLLGISLAIGSALFWGLYIVLAKGEAEKVGGLTVNAITFIIGSLITLPLLIWLRVPRVTFDPQAWPEMLYLTLGITCGAFILFLYALQYVSANTGSLIFFIKPLLATFLAAWWLQEKISPLFLVGTCIVIIGLLFSRKKTSPPN